jgi:arsenate reductase
MSQTSVLFVCTLRGGRARIAELFATELSGATLRADCACFEPGPIRGLPVRVMQDVGLEFSPDLVSSVFQQFRSGEAFDYVVSMCDESGSELCELFRRNVDVMYAKKSRLVRWDVEDFSALTGTEDERLAKAEGLRDRIRVLVEGLLEKKIGVKVAETV